MRYVKHNLWNALASGLLNRSPFADPVLFDELVSADLNCGSDFTLPTVN